VPPQEGDRRFPSHMEERRVRCHGGMIKAYLRRGDDSSGFVDKTSMSNIDKARAHMVPEILIDAVVRQAMLTKPGGGVWH